MTWEYWLLKGMDVALMHFSKEEVRERLAGKSDEEANRLLDEMIEEGFTRIRAKIAEKRG
jgi:hypothetical protein